MKKPIILYLSLLLSGMSLYGQQDPVKWNASYKAISAKEGEILITATIEKSFHIYSQRPTEAGPISTAISFAKSKAYQPVGKAEETGVLEEYDKVLEAKVFSFANKAEFRQKIRLSGKSGAEITFKVVFTCCNDRMCMLPKTIDLSVKTQ